jgi:hypothetical protein
LWLVVVVGVVYHSMVDTLFVLAQEVAEALVVLGQALICLL